MPTIRLDKEHPVLVNATESSEVTVKNLSPEKAYYKQSQAVSATNNSGELTEGQELTFNRREDTWFIGSENGVILEAKPTMVEVEGSVTTSDIVNKAVTGEKIANETILNGNVKKETLEPNRLEKEKLTSTQVKPKGLTGKTVLEAESVENEQIKKEVLEPNRLEKEKLTSEQIKAEGIKAASYEKESVEAAAIKKETVTGVKLVNATITGKQHTYGVPGALTELKENTSIEASSTESTTVYLSIVTKAEAMAFEVIADGKPVQMFRSETLLAANTNVWCSFDLKAAAKFEVKTTTGKLETSTTTKSVYVIQAG